ncbi:hypothetical protein K439DRAFT_1613810 [Ramaria rubella]|nr:hypothetical protein K439DRAFT_1613810 [Ramaria rubella]
MPARADSTRCRCANCIVIHPEGKIFSAIQLKAHLAKLQAEQWAQLKNEELHEQSQEIEAIAAQVLALMISDDGPDLTSQPSRLWASCLAVQEQTSSVLIPLDPSTHLLSEVVEGVKHLFISQGDPSLYILGNHTESQPRQAPSGAQTTVPSEQANHHRISKKERSRHTLKILENFHAIKLRIPPCWVKLSGSPSYIILGDVQSKLKGLRIAVKKVTRRTPTIDQGRTEIVQELERLEARVTELNVVIPHASEEPVRVDCDHLDEIAQLSMFLGVVCMVIMGIS